MLTFQEKDRIIRIKIRIQCITVFSRTRTSGKECLPYSSHPGVSLHSRRNYSIPLDSDFHLCNRALFFHLLFQFMVLCCQDIQKVVHDICDFSPSCSSRSHIWTIPKNIICQQASSPVYPSVAMITLFSPKGFPFFSKCCICLLPPPFPPSLSYSHCVVIDPTFTLTY